MSEAEPQNETKSREKLPFTEDGRIDKAGDFLRDLLVKMGMRCTVHLTEPGETDDDSDICLDIEGPDAGRIIGKKGQTLASLQYLVYRVVNRAGLPRRHVLVDAEGYTQRREDTLAAMACRLGKQAVDDGKIITFEPMSPRDRRVVPRPRQVPRRRHPVPGRRRRPTRPDHPRS